MVWPSLTRKSKEEHLAYRVGDGVGAGGIVPCGTNECGHSFLTSPGKAVTQRRKSGVGVGSSSPPLRRRIFSVDRRFWGSQETNLAAAIKTTTEIATPT